MSSDIMRPDGHKEILLITKGVITMVHRLKRCWKRLLVTGLIIALCSTNSLMSSVYAADSSTLQYQVKGEVKELAYADTPVGQHGALSVEKVSTYTAPTIVDEAGQPVQLRAVSTHGVQWFPQYVNEEAFQSLRDEWGMNAVRLALYPREGGYLHGNQELMDRKLQEGVQAATELGMYVIIDWHVLSYNPNDDKEAAKTFFQKYATLYKDYKNIIFEICNEPTGTPWYNGGNRDLYTYCKEVSKVIRDCGNNSIIICGTNDWSQRVDEVATKPLKDDGFENIMYSIHFYAATHYDNIKNNYKKAIESGTPVFATEFSCCDASGNGGYDFANADDWMKLFARDNVSYACWSLCNKAESASLIASSSNKLGRWTSQDLTRNGIWLINTSRAFAEGDIGQSGVVQEPVMPEVSIPVPEPEVQPQPEEQPQPEIQPRPEQPSAPQAPSTGGSTVSGSAGADIQVMGEWNSGLVANGIVTNLGETELAGWTVSFTFDGEIIDLWCAKLVSHVGNQYVITAETYNEKLWPKGQAHWGFVASKPFEQAVSIQNVQVSMQ